jgi:hypothetical protein
LESLGAGGSGPGHTWRRGGCGGRKLQLRAGPGRARIISVARRRRLQAVDWLFIHFFGSTAILQTQSQVRAKKEEKVTAALKKYLHLYMETFTAKIQTQYLWMQMESDILIIILPLQSVVLNLPAWSITR